LKQKMNQKERARKRTETIKKYHTPGCQNYIKRAKNALYASSSPTFLHEVGKLFLTRKLKKAGNKFISEAVRNGEDIRVDIVCLDDGLEYEVETTKKRAERFKDQPNTLVFELWDKDVKKLAKQLENKLEELCNEHL